MSARIKSRGQNPCKFKTGPGGGIFLYPAFLFWADMACVESSGIILRYFIIGWLYAFQSQFSIIFRLHLLVF
ncbi:hypothetical protein DXA14_22415 [Hungatella hathewayi]|nr:hypothetical protein DXA14_22415 [Hungatella hathewayi]